MGKSTQEIVQDPTFLKLPDGEQDKVLSAVDKHFAALPDGERSQVLQRLRTGRSLEAVQPDPSSAAAGTEQPPKSGLQQTGEAVGRATQFVGGSLAQGLAMFLGAPSDIIETAVNALSGYARARAQNPDLGAPDLPMWKLDLPLGGEEINALLPDGMKPPKDMNGVERIVSRGIQEIGSAAVPIAASVKLLSHVNPKTLVAIETALAASGGMTAQTLKELIPNSGPLTEFMGELIGSFGPTGVLKLIRKTRDGLATVAGLRTEADLEKEIGGQLSTVTTPEELRAGIDKAEALQKDMPGFKPTTGQVTNSPGVIQSERAHQRSSSERANVAKRSQQANQQIVGDFLRGKAPEGKLEDTVAALESTRTRETAVLDAGLIRAQADVDLAKKTVSATTERLIHQADDRARKAEEAAQTRINALQGRITSGEAGSILRREYQDELNTFREQAAVKYADIDPTGEVHLPLTPLKRAAQEVRSEFDPRVESSQRVPADLLDRIDRLGMDWETRGRAEKALADLEAVGGKSVDQRGGFRIFQDTQGQGGTRDVIGIKSNYPSWYKDLTKGENPLDRETVEKALDTLRTGTLHGLSAETVKHVRRAIRSDGEFRSSPFFHPGMEVVGDSAESFQTVKRLESELHAQIREAGAAMNDPLSRRLNRLLDGVKDTMNQLDGTDEIARAFPGVADKYHDANEFYAKGVQRLKAGEAAALRHKDKWGRFRVHDEDVASQFLSGETSVDDFVQALGSREAARDALRDFARHDLYRVAVYPDMHPKAGQLNQAAAAKWVQRNEASLKLFPEIQSEVADAGKMQAYADQLRKEADELAKKPEAIARIKNPKVFGELDEVQRRQADLIDARDRTLGDWQKSVATEFLGLDADRAAQAIVRNPRPQTLIADVSKRIGTDADGQAGLNRALWDAALDRFSVDLLDAGGNRTLQAKKIEKFLSQNERWMTERFGEDRVASMRKSAEAMRMLEATGRPVLSGGSDTFANLSSVMTDWGPFLSRLYAERSGRASMQWVISERTARVLGKVLKSRTEEGAMELLDRAFADPKVAETMMLAAKNASEPLLEKRFRFHLGTPFGAELPQETQP